MKAWQVVAYTLDGDVYCPGCTVNPEDEDCAPVFAGDEWDYYPTCGGCGGIIDEVGLTSYGYEQEHGDQD